ncbi:homoserine kinase [Pyruvatibacter mobilis]|uniref:homoserine kinase n=1 Tax=Pyruvatibacter mobilis TaxID=1712261 RepID=UPI000415C230
MAVYTDISDEELTALVERYDIGTLQSAKGIAEGVENSNFLLHTTVSPFILTLYEKRTSENDLPFFLGLMEHLSARGLSCPVPVHARDGSVLQRVAGRPAALVTFLEGMDVKRPRAEHCQQVGMALARLHEAGADFGMTRANALSVDGWAPLAATAGDRADTVAEGLATLIARELELLAGSWPKDLPTGVIHADLFPDNVFFIGAELSGLIDFYFACTDAFAYDIAICLNAWCFEADDSFNVTKGRALLAGYNKVRALEPEEADALPLLARGAAMRFLLTRLVDWLDGPQDALVKPKDPREYLKRLRFHQHAVSAADYGYGG